MEDPRRSRAGDASQVWIEVCGGLARHLGRNERGARSIEVGVIGQVEGFETEFQLVILRDSEILEKATIQALSTVRVQDVAPGVAVMVILALSRRLFGITGCHKGVR